MRLALVACCFIAAGLAATAGVNTAAAKRAPVNWERLHRPFPPVSLASDGTCPVSPEIATVDGRPLVGRDPVHLFIVGDAAAGEVELGPAGNDGWRGQKTPWLVNVRYRGPFLIRGRGVDADAPVSFMKVYGRTLDELRFIATPKPTNRAVSDPGTPPATYAFFPSSTFFRTTGCYVVQIDGKHFTRQIIVRVRDGARR